ncbi:DUF2196 domain-containing protein [Metabacillus fastidiosus]
MSSERIRSGTHPYCMKVRLTDGQIGHVQEF